MIKASMAQMSCRGFCVCGWAEASSRRCLKRQVRKADPVTAIRLFMPYFVMAFLTWKDGIAFCQSGVTVHSPILGSLPR